MGIVPDESLPEVVHNKQPPFEVVPNSAPHVLQHEEAANHRTRDTHGEKYPVIIDSTPKLPNDSQQWPNGDPNTNSPTTQHGAPPWDSLPAGENTNHNAGDGQPTRGQRLCGLRRRNFITVIVVALVIIAAAIGGGVGGTRGHGSSQLYFLNNQTAPVGLAFQAFTEPYYLGNVTPILNDEGFHDLGESRRSYVWLPDGTGCCLTFCADLTTSTGWWCEKRFRTNASAPFSRVSIWCGGNDGKINTTCS